MKIDSDTPNLAAALRCSTGSCCICGHHGVGTELAEYGNEYFTCANCDEDSFALAAEKQKEAWLRGAPVHGRSLRSGGGR